MSDIKEKLEEARQKVKDRRLALAEAQAEYDLALLEVKDLQRRVFYSENSSKDVTNGTDSSVEKTEKPSKPNKPAKPEDGKDEEEESPKPSKPESPNKTSKPSKPNKPAKPSPKEEESSDEEEQDEEIPEKSTELKATDAQSALRDMDGRSLEEIAEFIEGDSRKTVKDVASDITGHDFHEESAESVLGNGGSDSEEEENKPSPPDTPSKPKKKEESEDSEEESDDEEEEDGDLDKTIDDLTDGEDVPEDYRVELPDGVDRPDSAPNCFGNSEVYDPDSSRCMVCIFDFECEEAQEAIENG